MAQDILGALRDFTIGNPGGYEQIDRFRPHQQQSLKALNQAGQGALANPYQGFEPIRQQALNTFNQQIVPGLSERFNAMGDNSLSSPGFASQLGSAGAQLSSNLAAQQSQFGQQNMQNALQMLQLGLTPEFDTVHRQASPGLLQYLMQGLGMAGGGALGGAGGLAALLPFLSSLGSGFGSSGGGSSQQLPSGGMPSAGFSRLAGNIGYGGF